MCVEPFIALRYKIDHLRNFSWTIKRHEESNVILPFSPDVKVQEDQREKMTVTGFLAALPSEYDSIRAQILSNPEVSSFQETFSRILRIKISSPTQMSNALVG